MTETTSDGGDSDEQAIDVPEATDAETIRERLPEDIQDELTERAFSPGSMRKLLRDTYFIGPIGIGRGGFRLVYGGGQPGTELRRPNGALYNFPRSWRYAALERALSTGLIVHVGKGRFAATERGVAVLDLIDQCPDCGIRREPYIKHSRYVGNPNTEGSVESHDLTTQCPQCGANGYGEKGSSSVSDYEEFDRDEDALARAQDEIDGYPEARTYGGDRSIDPDAAYSVPEVDSDAIESVVTEHVENYTEPRPREVYEDAGVFEDIYDREVVTVPGDGDFLKFYGTDDAVVATEADSRGDVHFVVRETFDDVVDRLNVKMSYEVAVEGGAKEALRNRDGQWTGEVWHIDAHMLGDAISALTAPEGYFGDDRTVTVTHEAADLSLSPLPGEESDEDED